ncbi:MAG: tRNA (adenosine(37)-N6)-threonylcarbamoyltransferase complex dimerization subunit type 1 TsaB [Flavobacteriaceae bacterium]
MALILNLETATTNCSVSLAEDGEIMALKEHNSESYSHSEQLHVFIEKVMQEAGKDFQDLDALTVSSGPGSYTGLRIGVSAAKGLCFALDIPLIAVSTLESLAHLKKGENGFIIPVLDARRMEVYSAVFDANYTMVREVAAEIIDEQSFMAYAAKDKVHIIGSGAAKCRAHLKHSNLSFNDTAVPTASIMGKLAHEKFLKKAFEDVAYYEPFYLKDFIGNKIK